MTSPDVIGESISIEGRTFEFYFDKGNVYCLRFFNIKPLTPIEADLINESHDKIFEWNYENNQVNFWPKRNLCGEKDEILFSILIKALDILTGFITRLSLAELVMKSLSNWLTYIDENVLISKQLIQYEDAQLRTIFKTYMIEEGYRIELSISGLAPSTATAYSLKSLVKKIDKDVKVESLYPFFNSILIKNVNNIVSVLKFYKRILSMLT